MKRFIPITIFSIAMAFLEATVVVYLRQLYYPEGFNFELKAIPANILAIECLREISTLVILLSVAVIAGKKFSERFAIFLYTFGIWDIFYYIFLKQTLDWPQSLLTRDVLFLIPVPWVAPVLAPVLVAVAMVIAAVIVVMKKERGYEFKILKSDWLLGFIAAFIIFVSFILYFPRMRDAGLFYPYHWELFAIGIVVGIFSFYRILKRARKVSDIGHL